MSPEKITEHAMNARALNLAQARLIANSTPEDDSLLDHVRALAKSATPEQREHLTAILDLLRTIAGSNSQEGELQRAVIGASEQMATDAAERRVRDALGVKAIANALREPLGVLAHPERYSAGRYAAAVAVVNDVLERVPAEKLTALSVRHELGVRKYTTLVDLVEAREAVPA